MERKQYLHAEERRLAGALTYTISRTDEDSEFVLETTTTGRRVGVSDPRLGD